MVVRRRRRPCTRNRTTKRTRKVANGSPVRATLVPLPRRRIRQGRPFTYPLIWSIRAPRRGRRWMLSFLRLRQRRPEGSRSERYLASSFSAAAPDATTVAPAAPAPTPQVAVLVPAGPRQPRHDLPSV